MVVFNAIVVHFFNPNDYSTDFKYKKFATLCSLNTARTSFCCVLNRRHICLVGNSLITKLNHYNLVLISSRYHVLFHDVIECEFSEFVLNFRRNIQKMRSSEMEKYVLIIQCLGLMIFLYFYYI